MAGKPTELFEMPQSEIASRLQLTHRVVERAEARAIKKLRDGLANFEDELFAEPQRAIRAGRWNGKKIVRMG